MSRRGGRGGTENKRSPDGENDNMQSNVGKRSLSGPVLSCFLFLFIAIGQLFGGLTGAELYANLSV